LTVKNHSLTDRLQACCLATASPTGKRRTFSSTVCFSSYCCPGCQRALSRPFGPGAPWELSSAI
jgi:hypothetical protein